MRKVAPTTWTGDVLLTKSSTKIKVFDAATGGTEITFNGTDNKFANSSLPKTLYVQGETESSAMQDVTLTLTSDPGGCDDEVTYTVINVEFIETWSDKFAGIKQNWLPGHSGTEYDQNIEPYIVMGTRSDDKIYAKTKVKIEPDTPDIRSKLIFYLSAEGTGTPAGNVYGNEATLSSSGDTVTLAGGNMVPPSGSPGAYPVAHDYRFVAGLDLDGDGSMDGDPCWRSEHIFKIFDASDFDSSYNVLTATSVAFTGLFHFNASSFLTAFYKNIPPVGSTASQTTFAINNLDHNTGAYMTAPVAGGGTDKRYTFPVNSDLSEKIMDSSELFDQIEYHMALEKPDVIEYFYDNPDATFTTLHLDLDAQLGFTFGDLQASLRGVDIRDLDVTVLVSSWLEVTSLRVHGEIVDLYDFNYSDPLFNKNGVIMQSGFGTHTVLGKYGGHVYRVEIIIDSTALTDEFTTYFQ